MAPSRSYIVTGGNAGLGLAYGRVLAKDPGNVVVIACRDAGRGEAAARTVDAAGARVRVLPIDLADLSSVRAFPEAFRRADLPPLAGLVCNAGVQGNDAPTRTRDGHEATFGVNHLAHYLLARLMLGDLREGGRIVFVSSNTHDPATKTGMPEPRYTGAETLSADAATDAGSGRRRYTTSKLCNIYCTYELARRLRGSGDAHLRSLRVDAFDPGMVPGTGLARSYRPPLRFAWSYLLPALTLVMPNVNRPTTSAERLAALVTGRMGDLGGRYVSMGRAMPSSPLSQDPAHAEELWTVSAAMTGLPVDLGGTPSTPGRRPPEPCGRKLNES